MFQALNVDFLRGQRRVISDVNLELRTGELTVVIGPNGAGKSTLLKLLTGDLKPTRGDVVFDKRNLRQWNVKELANRRAVLSQSTNLVFPFTVHEVISLALPEGIYVENKFDVISGILSMFELDGFEHRLFQELSGGEQQRVHLARVVCQLKCGEADTEKFLFLDEPVSSLDIKHQINVLSTVRSLLSSQLGAMVILHDLNLAAAFADRVIIIDEGRIVANDTMANALRGNTLSEVFEIGIHVSKSGRKRKITYDTPLPATTPAV